MRQRWSFLINTVLAAASLLLFMLGGHLAANALIGAQRDRQLAELNGIALRRSESAVDFGVETLDELATGRPVTCDPASMQTVRLHVYRRGAVKDIRLTGADGSVRCSAYSETLEFDKEWPDRNAMLETGRHGVRLFRVDQFFGTALGVMLDNRPESGLVAILGVSGSLFDIMPGELRDHSNVVLELSDGRTVASASSTVLAGDAVELSLASTRYPLQTTIRVEKAALANWDTEPYGPIMALATTLGAVFAVLVLRLLSRPESPLADLDRAIATGEFVPWMQPIFSIGTGAIVGAEVLARRVRPDGAVIPPSRFIELAEHSGRIEQITWQLLASALAQLRGLMKKDKTFKLSINISPAHFVAPGFVAQLRRVVAANGVATRQVALEITERQTFDDPARAAEVVAEVRSHGFKVAIDDVGIGHSGLSQIQSLGADILKIDKFFVDSIVIDKSAGIVVEMLVRLAEKLNMTIVAEGIETAEQRSALAAYGVGNGQGYLVSPPMPAEKFLDFVDEHDSAPSRDRNRRTRAA